MLAANANAVKMRLASLDLTHSVNLAAPYKVLSHVQSKSWSQLHSSQVHGGGGARGSGAAAGAAEHVANNSKPSFSRGGDSSTISTQHSWQRGDLHVVLVHPQIPQNAGNIARTCAATSIALHLVGPLGFELDSAKLKRAGLDYWDWVTVAVHPSWADFEAFFSSLEGPKRMIAFSKFAKEHYAQQGMYLPGDWLLFGAETTGLPPEVRACAGLKGGMGGWA